MMRWLVLGLTGCIDKIVLEPVADKLDGIYEVASLTRNSTACEPGTEIIRSHTHALAALEPFTRDVAAEQVFGRFEILSCASQAECRDRHALLLASGDLAGQPPVQFQFLGEELGDDLPDTIIQALLVLPQLVGTTCQTGRIDTLIARDGGTLHVSRKTSIVVSYPSDGGGCDQDAAIDVARDAPCEQLELLDADIVEELDD